MERIIIREEDNTFNVEGLSSYDVAYVPGFGYSSDLFRVPTLVTSRYKFLELFGAGGSASLATQPRRFESDQMYPEASETEAGFPTYAIPGYTNLQVDSQPINITSFIDLGTLENYYLQVAIESDEVGVDWAPEDDVNYFLRSGAEGNYTIAYSELPLTEGSTYIETYGAGSGNYVYRSNIIPYQVRWFENGETSPVLTTDSQISVSGDGETIKQYYTAANSTPPMFNAGAPDPGFRYALYLLSLGMPVYYEQMNSEGFEEIDLTSDFNTAMNRYSTIVETSGSSDQYISPYDQGWYYYEAGTYKKCTDQSIKYRNTPEDRQAASATTWYYGADVSIDSMYTGLSMRFMGNPDSPDYSFDSMGDYSIKYITSGGYPTFEYGTIDSTTNSVSSGLAYAMIDIAAQRQDSVALIDHTDNPERSIYESDSLAVINKVRSDMADYSSITLSYGAMFTPWYTCTHSAVVGDSNQYADYSFMPASLAFLSSLANQVKNNQTPWLAVSGVSRGKIPYFGSLHTQYMLTNNVADSYQTVPTDAVTDYALISINPITYIRQYGYCIWGNRTLRNNKSGTKATSFLNIRNVVSDIKKRLYEASQQLLFEQNTEMLWIHFKSLITPLLDTMVSNSILSDYRLTKFNINPDSGEPVPAYMVLANIQIRPINSVEVFDLTVQIENTEFEVAETE